MIKMLVTSAGKQALINAQQSGTNAVKIAQIGVGTGKYTPTANQTTLQQEIKRLNIVEGGSAGDNAIHVGYQDEGDDAYSIYEFGLFLDNGVLFAVYSSSALILQKSASATAFLVADISLDDIDVKQITFGDVSYKIAAATTENAGVLALATSAEVAAGSAGQVAITPATLGARTATTSRTGLVELATNTEATTGTDTARATTPAGVKAAITATLATNAETLAGTLSTKAVTPAGLDARTATTGRTGLVELATEAEVLAGTDTTRAVTPSSLKSAISASVSTASETNAGVVQLATTTEAQTGSDTTKAVTPAGVKSAITNFSGNINNAKVIATGATTARTLASRFADGITPKDFGANGNGTTDDTAAFTALEAKATGRDVDLEGLTYLVTTRPSGNNYYNGNFKVNGVTVKPVYDFYKYGGTAESYTNIKRDFSEFTRGGAALLAADFVRLGAGAGAVVQSAVADDVNRYLYTLHATTDDRGVVNRFSLFKLGGATVVESSAYTTDSAYIGHQGLAIEYRAGGGVKLWASMAYGAAGASVTSKGTKAVRFNPPTSTGQNIDSSVEIFNLFPEVEGSNQAVTVAISYSGKYLIAKYNLSGNNYRVRIFKLSDFTTAGDYSNKYIHEFTIALTRDTSSGVSKALQGIACDDRNIYFLAAAYGYNEKHSLYVTDMYGNVQEEYRDVSVGKEIGRSAGTTYYEPQSLFFMNLNGQPKLCMQIATGDNAGDRLCQVIALNTRTSYFFPTGNGTGDYNGVYIDEFGRMINSAGNANLSFYPSGLSQYAQVRDGANQMALARFSADSSGNNFVFYKSRGAKTGESGSVNAGDNIGLINFMADNGNIDYEGTTQGARVGYIGGYVSDSSDITSGGTSNLGIRGSIRIMCNSDTNTRTGTGIEIMDNTLRPTEDNLTNLGTSGRRFKAIYAVTDVISTSDEKANQDIDTIPDEVLEAWGKVNFKQFKFKCDVAEDADNAKIFFGVIAQQVMQVFKDAGLNACDYGLICEDEQDEQDEQVATFATTKTTTDNKIYFKVPDLWGDLYICKESDDFQITSEPLTIGESGYYEWDITGETDGAQYILLNASTWDASTAHTINLSLTLPEAGNIYELYSIKDEEYFKWGVNLIGNINDAYRTNVTYGVRYREAMVLENAYQRKKIAELEARLAALEIA